MIKLNHWGFYSLAGGILTLLFQAISSIAQKDFKWKQLAIKDLMDARYATWIDEVSLLNLNILARYILDMPVFLFFFCLTILLCIRSMIKR